MRLKSYITEAITKAAFFISPYGHIIPIDINHIDTIIKHPDKFGLTKRYIESVYEEYNEKLGVEGKARNKIIADLIKDGWIRLRRYPNKFWAVDIYKLNKKVKDYIYDWSKKVLHGFMGFKEQDKHMPVKIMPLISGSYTDTRFIPIKKIAQNALYNESEVNQRREVLVETTIENMSDIEEYTLNESGYSRLMSVMSGLVPTVKTFVIVTWENPMGKEMSSAFNKEAGENLRSMLKRGNFSYRQIKGRYGNFENPFIVFNVSLNTAKNIGFEHEKYKQDAIIYGNRYSEEQKEGMIYRMIYSDNRPSLERRVWKSLNKDSEDMYSEYKGRKFIIPFFDDNEKHMIFLNGKKSPIVEEGNIYYEKDFTQKSIKKLDDMAEKLLDEQGSGYSLYINRGELSLELHKLYTMKMNE